MRALADRIDDLAAGLHEYFIVREAEVEGLTPVDDVFFRDWEELPDELQQAYRDAVRALVGGLEAHGLRIALDATPMGGVLPTSIEPALDDYAELCHGVWRETLTGRGWSYAPTPTDLIHHTNAWLEPWEQLSESKRDRVRTFLRGLPELLLRYGLRLERIPADSAADAPEVHSTVPLRVLPADQRESLAMAWHDAYVRHHIEAGESVVENPGLRPWEHLHPDLQETRRSEAARLGQWVQRVGLAIARGPQSGAEVSPDEIGPIAENLAAVEHGYWEHMLRAHGWEYGQRRVGVPESETEKLHPDLMGWDRLSESSQAAERALILDLPAILETVGLRLVHA